MVLDKVVSGVKKHAVWFQNFNTTTGVWLNVEEASGENELFLAPAQTVGEHVVPSTLIVQSTGGDSTLVNAEWNAWQDSGGAVNLKCGRW